MEALTATIGIALATLSAILVVSLSLLSTQYRKQQDADSIVTGCRRIGLVGRSNMDDQYSPAHDGKDLDPSSKPKVKAIFIYPIKSCGIVELADSECISTGLRYDRQFCFAQLKSEEAQKKQGDFSVNSKWIHYWRFVTQRNVPRLSQISTQVWIPDLSSPTYSPDAEWVKTEGCVVCSFAFTPEWSFNLAGLQTALSILKAKLTQRNLKAEPLITFKLPIAPGPERLSKYPLEELRIWKDSPVARNITSEIPHDTLMKLKYFLGVSNPIALFQADPQNNRQVFRNAPRKEEAGYQPGVGFADAYPLSIMGVSSVQSISQTMKSGPLPLLNALRFRANVYITNAPPFKEDDWKIIEAGTLKCHVSCRTTRCQLPNVDPVTGIKHKAEPYATLQKTRGFVDEGAGAHPVLGMQMVPLLKDEGACDILRVGDDIEVLETGEHFYLRMFTD